MRSTGRTEADADLGAAIRAIWERRRDEVLTRVDVVEEAVAEALAGSLEEGLRIRAEREAHKLAGSLGTFGFERGSELARDLEVALQASDGSLRSGAPRLARLVMSLRQQLERVEKSGEARNGEPAIGSETAELERRSPHGAREPQPGEGMYADAVGPRAGPTVLILGDGAELSERLAAEARAGGMLARSVHDPADLWAAVREERPDVVLLDLGLPGGSRRTLELLSELSEEDRSLPVLVLTGTDAFIDRVEVARRGGSGFLSRSLGPTRVIGAVRDFVERSRATEARVLTVDDDPVVLGAVGAVLARDGLSIESLEDPLRFWEVLEATSPDLVVLDVDMPSVNGIELCRMMRADPRFRDTPVLFLTARTARETVHAIFQAGADDYVAKPVVGPELRTRVENRLERVALLRSLVERDGLTGLLNRRSSETTIGRLLRIAERTEQPFCLAVAGLDHLRRVNDRFGHAVGDAVLERFGKAVAQAFRGDEVVARWGGGEFVLGQVGMGRDDGVQRVADLADEFRDDAFTAPDGSSFGLTVSAGVSEFPGDGTTLPALYRAADGALQKARKAGGDRVLPAGWSERGPNLPDVVVVEDDEALAALLLHSLETRGYQTRWLSDGREAMDALAGPEATLTSPLLLLDVDLPGVDGLTLLRRLAETGGLRRTRVIMLTARAAETEVLEALELGAFDHVAKPFSVPVLMERVRRALRS